MAAELDALKLVLCLAQGSDLTTPQYANAWIDGDALLVSPPPVINIPAAHVPLIPGVIG